MLRHLILVVGLLLGHCAITQGVPTSLNNMPLPDATAIERASNFSSKLSANCSTPTRYYPQPIDHATFSGNYADLNSTFFQQIQIIDKYYKPGGPILVHQSPESPYTCIENGYFSQWAVELGALIVGIEHRYFGPSCPYGLNYTESATWKPKFMKPLTLENVLRDGVGLLGWVKKVAYPAAQDAKVIVIGGSYGGTLAAQYRTHYPDEIFGALASSPAADDLISDPTDSQVYAVADWTNMVINDISAEAASKIKTSVDDLRARMAAGKFEGLQDALHLCTPPNSTDQTDLLLLTITGVYSDLAQYNTAKSGFILDAAINATLKLNDSMAILGAANKLSSPVFLGQLGNADCIPWQQDFATISTFNYIICTYFPSTRFIYSQADSIFGSVPPDFTRPRLNDAMCQKAFGIDSVAGGVNFQRKVRVDPYTLQNTKRLLVSEGLYDPHSASGVTPWRPGASREHSRAIMISKGWHGSDASKSDPADPQSVIDARNIELNSFKEWLAAPR